MGDKQLWGERPDEKEKSNIVSVLRVDNCIQHNMNSTREVHKISHAA